MIRKILDMAKGLGACSRTASAHDWQSLVELYFSPQGREFCENNNFPDIDLWREVKSLLPDDSRIFVDAGVIKRDNDAEVAIIGATDATLTYSGAKCAHKIIVQHGAKATIRATRYAVVRVISIGANDITIEKDKTARVI